MDPLLIFAAQLHQAGHKDPSNRLAHATFAFFPTRQLAIDAVVSRIAEQAHGKTAAAFYESGCSVPQQGGTIDNNAFVQYV